MFCPAIIWYETGYSTFTLRQVSRRSWRIGQTKPVTVRFLCYENTAQVGCLRLMGRKLLVSMALEAKFSESGLQSMDDGADVLTTLARELVMNQGVGQSADDVWKALQAQQPLTQNPPIVTEPEALPVAPLVLVTRSASALTFCQEIPIAPARRKVAVAAFIRSALPLLILADPALAVLAPTQTKIWRSLWRVKHNCRFRRRLLRR